VGVIEAMQSNQGEDPRWSRFSEREWQCPSCGLMHTMPFDLACDQPDFWQGSTEKSPNSRVLTSDNILTEDFCIIDGQHYFVRCVLELTLIGWDGEAFGFGVWATLSKKTFALYREIFDSGHQGAQGPWFGWFSNRLKGYPDTLNLKCQVHPQEGRQRPYIELEATDHPLAVEQRTGITFDRLLDLYALNGHDLRDAFAS
jgi:hypothetical protein